MNLDTLPSVDFKNKINDLTKLFDTTVFQQIVKQELDDDLKNLLLALIVSKNDALTTEDINQGMRGKLGYVYTIVHYGIDHDYVKQYDDFLNKLNYNWRKYKQYIFHIENNVVALNAYDLASNAYNRINGNRRIDEPSCAVCVVEKVDNNMRLIVKLKLDDDPILFHENLAVVDPHIKSYLLKIFKHRDLLKNCKFNKKTKKYSRYILYIYIYHIKYTTRNIYIN